MPETRKETPIPATPARFHWHLPALLKQHGITPYALSQATGGSLSRNAIYRLVNNTPTRLEVTTLEALTAALTALTGRQVRLSDLATLE